ncbi:uncharacterized protein V1510DRAFT_402522 [Dipodascopsis tothii]|uniref:uncharacterized protein n=1 Tax=Dipodascopsis tothii TaxID=44089 RepID=UPI0034CD6324
MSVLRVAGRDEPRPAHSNSSVLDLVTGRSSRLSECGSTVSLASEPRPSSKRSTFFRRDQRSASAASMLPEPEKPKAEGLQRRRRLAAGLVRRAATDVARPAAPEPRHDPRGARDVRDVRDTRDGRDRTERARAGARAEPVEPPYAGATLEPSAQLRRALYGDAPVRPVRNVSTGSSASGRSAADSASVSSRGTACTVPSCGSPVLDDASSGRSAGSCCAPAVRWIGASARARYDWQSDDDER